jgi:hypothetical protein
MSKLLIVLMVMASLFISSCDEDTPSVDPSCPDLFATITGVENLEFEAESYPLVGNLNGQSYLSISASVKEGAVEKWLVFQVFYAGEPGVGTFNVVRRYTDYPGEDVAVAIFEIRGGDGNIKYQSVNGTLRIDTYDFERKIVIGSFDIDAWDTSDTTRTINISGYMKKE